MYTGLNDRDDVEIYEHDICECTNARGEKFFCEIQFVDGCFELHSFAGKLSGPNPQRDYLKCLVANHAVKVVGNLHQNYQMISQDVGRYHIVEDFIDRCFIKMPKGYQTATMLSSYQMVVQCKCAVAERDPVEYELPYPPEGRRWYIYKHHDFIGYAGHHTVELRIKDEV
jgi:hypothetical protein